MPLFYADASALAKTLLREKESSALLAYVEGADLVSSDLVLTEIPRALHRAAAGDPSLSLDALLQRARELIDALALLPLDPPLLAGAGALAEPLLRSLDAIHVAAAVSLHPIDAFVTYDERQAAAARLVGLRTVAPGA
jgi:predicted nucleic acid-binding protein